MFKNFCRCNAAVSDLYDGKSKNKVAVVFLSQSPWLTIGFSFWKRHRHDHPISLLNQVSLLPNSWKLSVAWNDCTITLSLTPMRVCVRILPMSYQCYKVMLIVF